MPEIDIQLDSTRVGIISLDPQEIYAHGGPEFPVLLIKTKFGLSAYPHFGQPTVNKVLTCISIAGEFCSPPERSVVRFQHSEDCYASRNDDKMLTRQVTFAIPLDLQIVDRIEQTRTGNLQAALKLKALMAVHSANGSAIETFRMATVPELRFTIPKSEWVEKLLPGMGYKGLELLEIQIGKRALAQQLPQSTEEIKQAQQQLLDGDWERAVQRCRNAIELIVGAKPLSIPVTSKFGDKINAFVNDHLTTSAEQAKLVAKQMNLIWEVSSPAAHPLPNVTKADAEFIVRTTTALIGFCGKLLTTTS